MTRKQKLLFNTAAGVVKQFVVFICGFILPRYMLAYYGSSVNGLISSITHFLNFISLMDMGVGAVVQANLYKPLADKDNETVSSIVKSSERFFRRLAYIFIGYIVVLCFIFPSVLNKYPEFDAVYTVSLLLIIAASTLAQYLFGMTYQLLLNADQRSYVQLLMQIGTVLLNTILSVVLMKMGCSVHVVKLVTAVVFVLRPIGQMLYVKTHYDLNRKIKIIGEPIKQKWNGFSQHLASVVCQNIDVAVLTVFSTLEKVSVYSVYFLITNGVQQIVMTAATGLEAYFGNIIAKESKSVLLRSFETVEWIIHAGVTFLFTVAAVTIVPFVTVYTRGIKDVNYNEPLFGYLLVFAYAALCLRVPYFRVIKAAGHFKETQNGAYISAILNIIITVATVFRFGLVGAALGTLAAMLYHTCYFVWYLRKNILDRSTLYFVKYMVSDSVTVLISWLLTHKFEMTDVSYAAWVILALKVAAVVAAVCVVMNYIGYRKYMLSTLQMFRKKRGT